jgi:hypothetical protein
VGSQILWAGLEVLGTGKMREKKKKRRKESKYIFFFWPPFLPFYAESSIPLVTVSHLRFLYLDRE